MRRRTYLRLLGSVPVIAGGVTGCLSNTTGGTGSDSTGGNASANVTGMATRAIQARDIGEVWTFTDSGTPTVADNGTIVAEYRASDPYSRTVRLRLWPCEGETLDALGSCSLGNLPDRKRANESVETADRSFGDNAFLWWSGVNTDIEVATADNVFRLTHMPAVESTQELPSRDARIEELTEIARLQTDHLG